MSKLKPRSERYAIPPNWQLVACLGWVLVSVCISPVAYGQALNTATIRGQVLDQSRAAITNAQVVVTNNQTGVHRETTTDEKGNFTCASLPLTGEYTVLVSQSGFAAEEVTDVTLQAGEAASFEITLKPQGENSVVTVSGTTEGVRADSPQLSTRLDLQKIDNTPILGRKVTSLVLLDSA
ncbi:MAG TPA: carboxypeptidase-like regulatory domain-containing protein, partial [Acidobacteriota bacterium]|nr:carboxypeptidase-like regulatory domain-containing protein [Acidobacteriota bacterium]